MNIKYAIIVIATLITNPGWADPVAWSLTGTLSDGGSMSGTFYYDADTNQYSNANFITSGGTSGGMGGLGDTYTTVYFGNVNTLILSSVDQATLEATAPSDAGFLAIGFDTHLGNAGGSVSFDGAEGTWDCTGASAPYSCSGSTPERAMTGTSGNGTPIPPPPPPAPQPYNGATSVPTMNAYGVALTALGLIFLSGRRLADKKSRQV